MIGLVELEEKRNSRVGELSGGQKQRLAGRLRAGGRSWRFCFWMSPQRASICRRAGQLWDLIERFKLAGRTILLTTHYMDEAERLLRSRRHCGPREGYRSRHAAGIDRLDRRGTRR